MNFKCNIISLTATRPSKYRIMYKAMIQVKLPSHFLSAADFHILHFYELSWLIICLS